MQAAVADARLNNVREGNPRASSDSVTDLVKVRSSKCLQIANERPCRRPRKARKVMIASGSEECPQTAAGNDG